jgi:hypothetical protein
MRLPRIDQRCAPERRKEKQRRDDKQPEPVALMKRPITFEHAKTRRKEPRANERNEKASGDQNPRKNNR